MDIQKLRSIVQQFAFSAKPNNANGSAPCTVQDINNLISKLSEALNSIIDEIEDADHL